MKDSIERAKDLLAAAKRDDNCEHLTGYREACPSCVADAAVEQIAAKAPDLLAWAIGAVEALKGTTEVCCNIRGICGDHEEDIAKALAEFERLFPPRRKD